MFCPRCKKEHDILQYIRLVQSPEFELETVPIYKCPSCKWMFAPAGDMPQDVYERLYQEMQESLREIVKNLDKVES